MKTFELPPMLSGTAEEQIDQLREYLMRLALNTEEEQMPAPVVNTQPEKPSGHGSSFGKAQLAKIYPVGSIYLSVNETDPGTLFGGTWQQIKDTFLLAAGDSYAAGDVGGEATHTLTVDETPSHAHNIYETSNTINVYTANKSAVSGGSYGTRLAINTSTSNLDTSNEIFRLIAYPNGGGQPHNNMPPYLTVFMWQRIA